jgi:hypothetical protein
MITEALHITATNTLDFHANLLPVHIRLNHWAFNAAMRQGWLDLSSHTSSIVMQLHLMFAEYAPDAPAPIVKDPESPTVIYTVFPKALVMM